MDAIMKIIKLLDDSSLLIKGVSETIKNVAKERRGGFLSMLVGTLVASLIPTVFSSISKGSGIIPAYEGAIKADTDF